ncbi:Ghr [Acrasis kona]|uniref:Ghr n=1 Tax=Acrasis kona TaxID=1008807 RepID=A0AAW2ZG95_9EUKA
MSLLHRKRLHSTEFGLESEDDIDCFRMHKRYLSEELSLRISELKLNNGSSTQITYEKSPPLPPHIIINKAPKTISHSVSPPTSSVSPTSLSRSHRKQQKALMLYTPPVEEKKTEEIIPKIIKEENLKHVTSILPHNILSHFLKVKKPSQEIVLYKDPNLIIKEAYEKTRGPHNITPSDVEMASNPFESKPIFKNEIVEEINIDDIMQED